MAEEQEENKEQENESSQKKSSNLVVIIVIVVLVFTLIIGGVIVAMLLSGGDEPQQQQMRQGQGQGQMMNDSNAEQQQQPRSNNKATHRIIDTQVGPMFPLDGFTVNLLSDSGRRYLKVTINLELKDEETATELEAKSPVIRDILIRVLTSKTLEEIATAKGKDKLKDQLVNQINLRLQDGEIKNVYFVEFVIQ